MAQQKEMASSPEERDVWIGAAMQVLADASRPLHYTEIKCEILQRGLVVPGLSTTLEYALANDEKKRITQMKEQTDYYMIAVKDEDKLLPKKTSHENSLTSTVQSSKSMNKKSGLKGNIRDAAKNKSTLNPKSYSRNLKKTDRAESSSNKMPKPKNVKKLSATNNSTSKKIARKSKMLVGTPSLASSLTEKTTVEKYEERYKRLKRLARDLIFINAAYCDESRVTEDRITLATYERKYLLERLLDCKKASEAAVPTKDQKDNQIQKEKHTQQQQETKKTAQPKTSSGPTSQQSTTPVTKPQQSIAKILGDMEKKIKRKPSQQPPVKASKASSNNQKSQGNHKSKPKERKSRASTSGKSPNKSNADGIKYTKSPLQLGDLTVYNVGKVNHINVTCEQHICPVGYHAARRYLGIAQERPYCLYTCTISDHEKEPVFEIKPEGEEHLRFHGNSATECHNKLLLAINTARGSNLITMGDRGADFFGFTHPSVQQLLQKQVQSSLPKKSSLETWNNLVPVSSHFENLGVPIDIGSSTEVDVLTKIEPKGEIINFTNPLSLATALPTCGTTLLLPVELPNG